MGPCRSGGTTRTVWTVGARRTVACSRPSRPCDALCARETCGAHGARLANGA